MMKVGTKLFFAFFLMSLALLTAILFSYLGERKALTGQIHNHLYSVSSLQQARLLNIIEQNLERLKLVVSRTQLRLSLKEFLADKEKVHQDKMRSILVDARNSIPDFYSIEILTLDGEFVVSTETNRGNEISAHLNDECFINGQKGNSITNLFLDSENKLKVHLSGPLYLEGELLGVIVIDSNVENIITTVKDYTGLGESGETLLVAKDKNGDALFLTPTRFDSHAALKRTASGRNLGLPVVRSLRKKKEFLVDTLDYRKEPVLAATRFIEKVEWGLVVKIDRKEAFEPLNKLSRALFVFSVVTILIISFTAFYLIRSITSPISKLTEAAKKISAGKLPVSVEISSKDEIGTLAVAFNRMTGKLTESNAELLKYNKMLDKVFSTTHVLFAHMDKEFNFVQVNRAYATIHGRKPDYYPGRNHFDLYPDRKKEALFRQVMERGKPYTAYSKTFFYPHVRQCSIDYCDWTLLPIFDSAGEVEGLLFMLIDITARKRAEDAVALKNRINKIFLAFPDDAMYGEVLQVVLENMKSKYGVFSYIDEDGSSVAPSMIKGVREKCDGSDRSIRFARETWGDTIWARAIIHKKSQCSNLPSRMPHGDMAIERGLAVPIIYLEEVIGLLLVANKETDYDEQDRNFLESLADDIAVVLYSRLQRERQESRRKSAEDALVLAKEEWQRTFESIGDIATVLYLDLRIVRVNKKTCETFTIPQGELVGKFCYEVFTHRTEPCDQCPVVRCVKGGRAHAGEIRHKYLGKTFLVSGSPILDEEGELKGVVHIAKDITEYRSLESRLRQAQKMEAIGTLAGGIAHDFNNILAPILGYTEMVLESIPADSPEASELRVVFDAAGRAKDLVKQILSFSRQTEEERLPMKIQPVLKETLKLLRASLPTTIEIRQDIKEECEPILADPTQIHQIIMNLCTNAYHAMQEKGGVLEVSLVPIEIARKDSTGETGLESGNYVRLEINDTGQGMEQGVKDRIFDPYFTTKGKGKGTGLGLSVVHGIVKSLNGEITVSSQIGKGTTFNVYFPVLVKKIEMSGESVTILPLPTGRERLLIVDDEEEIVQLLKLMLSSLGYEVTIYTDSEECLRAFQSMPKAFDLVIADMTMPKLTGKDLAKKILKVRPEIPIIICTGFSELISKEEAKNFGIRKLIMKPIIKKELAMAVHETLKES